MSAHPPAGGAALTAGAPSPTTSGAMPRPAPPRAAPPTLLPTDAPPRRAPGVLFLRAGEGPASGPHDRLSLREEAYVSADLEGIEVAEDPAGPWRPLRAEPWLAELLALKELDRRGVKHAVREEAAPTPAAPVVVPPPPPDRTRAVLIGVAALAVGVIALTVAWVFVAT